MELHIFHLKPRSSFHFGVRGVGMEATTDYAPSDTVFGALCNTMRYLYGKAALEKMLENFKERQPPFQCGGAYPYVDTPQGKIRFYPAPLTLGGDLDSKQFDEKDLKKLRKVSWLSEAAFQQWLQQGKLSDIYVLNTVKALVTRAEAQAILSHFDALLNRHNTLTDEQKDDLLNHQVIAVSLPLWNAGDVPRVAIDRRTSAGNIFRAGRFVMAQDVGLWLGFDCVNEEWCKAHLLPILHQLGDWGLGGERSSGYGQFDINESETIILSYPDPQQHKHFINLAYYSPIEGEYPTLDEAVAYDLELRRGWMSNPENSGLRRKAVRMVKMGSVMKSFDNQNVYGSVVDVTPDVFTGGYTIYRNGYALALGVNR